jgi:hypothetical protein
MFPRKPVEPFDAAQEQVAVGGMSHGLVFRAEQNQATGAAEI